MRQSWVPCEVKKKPANKSCTSSNLEGYFQENFWREVYSNDAKDFFSKGHVVLSL